MKKFVLFAVVALFSAGLCSLSLSAQDSKVDIFGGYQYLHSGNITVNGVSEPGSSQGYNGWDVAPAYSFNKFFGVQGDFSGGYATISGVSTHVYTYGGGPLVSLRLPVITPYAHVLFGGTRLTGESGGVSLSTNGYTVMFGGGVDAKLNRLLAIRVAQVDWLYLHFSGFSGSGFSTPSFSGSSNVRISTGAVVRF
jgi:hypothetical protein